ncbi:DNA ligase [Paenibacillus aquistagni]|uniref:DNA ligase n=1 Tax=Paenibacillus aquistagni TaxID=1852522 RepID=UPI000B513766|nr:DNA ligase [Paenibacillus aquistagni]
MNITSMVRGMIGEAKPGDVRALELKQGQVVRGVVLHTEEGSQQAVVQINGVPVKAMLESPLQAGQSTLLRVEGQQDGVIILKPAGELLQQGSLSIADAIKQSGLPDEPWARSMLAELKRSGVELTPEVMAKLTKAASLLPAGKSLEEWMQTAIVALKRQLPITAETMRGLQQIMFGKPMHQLLQRFLDALSASMPLMNASTGAEMTGSGGASSTLGRMQQAQALVQSFIQAMPIANDEQGASGVLRQSGAPNGQNTTVQGNNGAAGNQQMRAEPTAQGAAASTAQIQAQSQAEGSRLNGQSVNERAGSLPASQTAHAGDSMTRVQSPESQLTQASRAGGEPASSSTYTSQAQGQVPSAVQSESWVGRLLQVLGVNHEHQVRTTMIQSMTSAPAETPQAAPQTSGQADAFGSAQRAQTLQAAQSPNAELAASAQGSEPQAAKGAASAPTPLNPQAIQGTSPGAVQETGAETIKSALMQLLQSDALPPSVREAAQMIVSSITGQQLLLSSDRSLPFAHISLFVPLITPDGEETAAVHIQARQGKKGELDPSNCRLWFDLDLKAMGHTVVDVNVIEKMVALNIHHANEDIRKSLEPYRPEIDSALQGIGYQLSAFRTLPISEEEHSSSVKQTLEDYTPAPYKGVDVRI